MLEAEEREELLGCRVLTCVQVYLEQREKPELQPRVDGRIQSKW